TISRKKNLKGRLTDMSNDHTLNPDKMPDEPEKATLEGKNKFIGFWFFLGGETVLFACLFGTYLALHNSNADDPTGNELFGLGLVFAMTMLLLTSSLTSVYAIYHMKNNDYGKMAIWFIVTMLLGLGFIGCEIYEFIHYNVEYGFSFRSS